MAYNREAYEDRHYTYKVQEIVCYGVKESVDEAN